MTDTRGCPSDASFDLRTLGTVSLVRSDGTTVLGVHGHHRRRLALLSVLAAAGERGRARDQILLLLWPEATQTRAQHSLDQLLYALRTSIGDTMFEGTNPLRLNGAVITSDVGRFNAALERGDFDQAVSEYHGPFLDGFFPNDAPEFERWADGERAGLAVSYADALRTLAQRATARGDGDAAVRWWIALSDSDPLSSKSAIGRIRAVAAAGDRAAALQYAKRHEALVARELGLPMDPAVAAVIDEIRDAPISPAGPLPPPSSDAPFATNGDSHLGQGPPPRSSPAPRRDARRWVGAAAIAAIATIVVAIAVRAVTSPKPSGIAAGEPSLAVLPFANVSRAPNDAALVDGLTEELLTMLGGMGRIRVIARTSTFAFRNSDVDVRRIADTLHVGYVLLGGLQRAGDKLHVQVRLVDGRDGATRWSQTYDRMLGDVFAVERDVAGAVARELDVQLSPRLDDRARAPTHSFAAHELFLRGNDPSLTRSDSAARVGLAYFDEAIALDSTYAAAYAGRSLMIMRLAAPGHGSPEQHRRQVILAEQEARRAIRLDDSLADGHAALAFALRSEYDFAAALSEMARAEALAPGTARIHEWLVQLYVIMNRPAEALSEGRRAVALDPLSPTANAELARALLAANRPDEALARLAMIDDLRPPLLRAASIAARSYAARHMWPQAIAESRRTLVGQRNGNGLLGSLLARAGRVQEARLLLDTLMAAERAGRANAFDIAAVYAGLGEIDSAVTWFERSIDERSIVSEYLISVLDLIGPVPRLEAARRRLGLQNR